jgi:elongation factor P--(R)-beta-lysine ligase
MGNSPVQQKLLLARAQLLADCRQFMQTRGVIEADTPVLWPTTIPDPNIASLQLATPTAFATSPRPWYLQTSPEFALKRLMSETELDLYEIKHVFRDEPIGRYHHPEFLMLEWYRRGFSDRELMHELAQLLALLLPNKVAADGAQTLTYHQAFHQYLAIDVDHVSEQILGQLALEHCAYADPNAGRETLLDLLMGAVIGPQLGIGQLTFITDYPIEQAALARARDSNPRVAARFEAYVDGLELANGFDELTDPTIQRARFESDNARRSQSGLMPIPIDEEFLAALAHLPACAGVALGLDRVLMLQVQATTISEIIPLPFTLG